MISKMAGVSDTLAAELPAFRTTIYWPCGMLHPLHLTLNASLVLVARSVHFSPLPSKILSDRRWVLFPKSTRNPLNGVSFTNIGHSINDSITKDLFSCTYDTLMLLAFLHGALLHLKNYLLSRLLWRYGPHFYNPARLFFIVTISLSFIFSILAPADVII